ncbi:MAG: PIN domain nuclease [Chloroflexi bacterium]|nr:PIN domain nuclease [Chloroflexota bacterium]
MSMDLLSRLIGMVVFALIGGRLGVETALALGASELVFSFFFSLVGMLFGLIVTPIFTVRPIRRSVQVIKEMPIEMLLMGVVGLLIGLIVALLMAFPLSLLFDPLGTLLPLSVSLLFGYFTALIFSLRAREIWTAVSDLIGSRKRPLGMQSNRQLLLDTSVLIDGRIVEIAKTGFLGGTLIVPRFVLNELHQVADSSDPLRRNRGRRGLAKLTELQRNNLAPVKIIEDEVEEINEVDAKLVALGMQMDAPILTNDFNLNRVAEAQGVMVLNINLLANAVRSVYIPGETFPIHIIQEGREYGQGVGYLEDGTMVVVENGKAYMDRTIRVTVTKLINKETGRMIFATPESNGGVPRQAAT